MKLQILESAAGTVAALLLAAATAGQSARPSRFQITELAPDIFVAIRERTLDHPVEGNVTFIVGPESVIVIDTSRTPSSAHEVIAAIRGVTPLPVRTIINTHWHGDHHHGNATYAAAYPGVTIVAHRATREDIATLGVRSLEGQIRTFSRRPELEAARQSGQLNGRALTPSEVHRITQILSVPDDHLSELEAVELLLQTLTFEHELRLYQDSREIRVFSGGAGNTRGDAVVYLPAERIVITGDLLVSTVPFMSMSYPHGWLARLDAIAELDFDVIVPGHGPLQRDRAWLDRHRELLRIAIEQVDRLVIEGASLQKVQARVDLTSFRDAYAGGDPYLEQEFDYRVGTTTPRHGFLEASSARASELGKRLASEALRLREEAPDASGLPEFIGKALASAGEGLSRVPGQVDSGRIYLALLELAAQQERAVSASFVVEHSNAADELEPFEKLWETVGPELERSHHELDGAFEGKSAAVRAQGELALHRILTHYRSSLPYAKAGEVVGALYDLGTAMAASSRAQLLAEVDDGPAGLGPHLEWLDELEAELSHEALELYGRDGAALTHHTTFIRLDAALKQARELARDGRRYGAALSLLEARLLLALVDGSSPAGVHSRLMDEPLHRQLFDPNRDHSLARIFWERALALAPSTDEQDQRTAAVILSQVLPLYFQRFVE